MIPNIEVRTMTIPNIEQPYLYVIHYKDDTYSYFIHYEYYKKYYSSAIGVWKPKKMLDIKK